MKSRVTGDDGEGAVEGEDGERPVRASFPKWEETFAGRTKRFGDNFF